MSIRDHLDISAYLVVGPENTMGRPVSDIVRAAVQAGFTCVQIRSKTASARELIALTGQAAAVLAEEGCSERAALLVDDRLDVVLAARKQGIKVDGVHVGQSDIPPEICRAFLGEDAIVGLSAPTGELLDYVRTTDVTGEVILPEGTEMVMPGDTVSLAVNLGAAVAMEDGMRFAIREGGRTVGAGVVTKIVK